MIWLLVITFRIIALRPFAIHILVHPVQMQRWKMLSFWSDGHRTPASLGPGLKPHRHDDFFFVRETLLHSPLFCGAVRWVMSNELLAGALATWRCASVTLVLRQSLLQAT